MSVTTVSSSMITDATILNADIGAAAAIATTKLGAGATVQVVTTLDSAVATGTTLHINDDSVPTNAEGVAWSNLDTAITPTHASNILLIQCVLYCSHSAAAVMIGVLYQDSGAGLSSVGTYIDTGTAPEVLTLQYKMAAGTTSATTFKIRAGGHNGGTSTFNGTGGGRKFGGVAGSSMTITEIKV